MSRTVFYTATSIDGFLADDGNSLDWLFAVEGAEEQPSDFSQFLDAVGVLVMGSTTYEWVHAHENLAVHPERWGEWYGTRPSFVFTSRTRAAVEGADIRFVNGDVADHWERIRDTAGGRDVWVVGGGGLAGQFAAHGLLDELRLDVAPVTLGSGAPLMPLRLEASTLHLESVEQRGQFARLRYAVRGRTASAAPGPP